MARSKSLLVAIVKDVSRARKAYAAEQKREQALLVRMQKQQERERKQQEREDQRNLKILERELAQRDKAEAAHQQLLNKQRAEVELLLDRYRPSLQRYDTIMQQVPDLEDDTSPATLVISLLKEAVSYVPELLDFHRKLQLNTRTYIADGGEDWEEKFQDPDYSIPFMLLACAYLQDKRYRYAIRTCQDAIVLGLDSQESELSFQTLEEKIYDEIEGLKHG